MESRWSPDFGDFGFGISENLGNLEINFLWGIFIIIYFQDFQISETGSQASKYPEFQISTFQMFINSSEPSDS